MTRLTLISIVIIFFASLLCPMNTHAGSVGKSPGPVSSQADDDAERHDDAPHDFDESPIEMPSTPLTTAQYDQALDKVQSDVEAISGRAAHAKTAPKMTAALDDLKPIVRCYVIYQRAIVVVDNRTLRSSLTRLSTLSTPAQWHQLLTDLDSQLKQIRAGLSVKTNTADEVQHSVTVVRSLLQTNEFASDPIPEPSASQKKLNQWGDSIGRWWHRLISKLHIDFGPTTGPSFAISATAIRVIFDVIGFLAAALLVALIIYWFIGYLNERSGYVDQLVRRSALAINEEEEELVSKRDYDRLILLARQNALTEEYRNAYRLVYLATLVLLDSYGVIRIERSRTNWEYLHHIKLSGNVDIHDLKLPITAEFDRIWYGSGEVDNRHFEKALETFDRLRDKITGRGAVGAAGRAGS